MWLSPISNIFAIWSLFYEQFDRRNVMSSGGGYVETYKNRIKCSKRSLVYINPNLLLLPRILPWLLQGRVVFVLSSSAFFFEYSIQTLNDSQYAVIQQRISLVFRKSEILKLTKLYIAELQQAMVVYYYSPCHEIN